MSSNFDKAFSQLQLLSPEEALVILGGLEDKRKQERFICYWNPYPKQGDHLKHFTADKKIFGVLGGNRSGKTELGSFCCIAWALGKDFFKDEPAWEYVKDLPIPNKANNIWVVGLDYPTLRDVIWREKFIAGKDHSPFLPRDPSAVTANKEGDFQIFFANGSVITGKSADSGREKFQAASVDFIWIDEECEADIFDECYARTLSCSGKIMLTLTPLKDTDSGVREPWVFDLHEEFEKGQKDLFFCYLGILDNPYVPEVEKQNAINMWSGTPEAEARLYGKFVRRSGLVYPEWNRKVHLYESSRVLPFQWKRIVSIDPAATGVTAAIWIAVSPEGDLYCYREYYEKDLTVSEHARSIEIRNSGDEIDIWLLDPTWGSQREAVQHKTGQQLYRDAGLPVRLPEVGEDFGLNVSRQYIQAASVAGSRNPRVFVKADLSHFIYEIEHYTWDMFMRGPQKGMSKEKPRKRDDHLMNAFQYACAIRPKGMRNSYIRSIAERSKDVRVNSYTF